jgi:2,4-dienoyl-CoA reductase-like NADH-dependent reductase (Old Yellow Enzyme family)/NADPH-dependent 2,4-dienoyl-CoA reductase/sulfur reductase-like enzyme
MMKKLFEPIKIGEIELRNRFVKLATQTNSGNIDGSVSDAQISHYGRIARGGAGLVIVEGAIIDESSYRSSGCTLRIDDDRFLAGLEELSSRIKTNGATAAIEIVHLGRVARFPERGFNVSVCEGVFGGIRAKALVADEIKKLTERFGHAALRAKSAGFQVVEIHGCYGYLIGSFLSPFFNKRSDEYGGNLENRIRFAAEVIAAIRSRVGSGFPVIFKISADEFIEGGLEISESVLIAKRLEALGVNCIDVAMGIKETQSFVTAPACRPPGYALHLSEAIKKQVHIPIIAVGRINDPFMGGEVLDKRKADLIGMGRALLADPDLPRKAQDGRFEEIRMCIACNRCLERLYRNLRVHCTVNPEMGREKEFSEIQPALVQKRVMVIGGGPAGMEAARISAMRGHNVRLYDRNDELGGQLRVASLPPHKGDIANLTRFLSGQIKKLKVDVVLQKRVDLPLIEEFKPDVVFVAIGAVNYVPPIPGADHKTVVRFDQVLREEVELGDEIVIAGGGMVGCETAEYLLEKGKKVSIIEMLDEVSTDMEPLARELLIKRLLDKGAKIITESKIGKIMEGGVEVIDKSLSKRFIPANSVVLALGFKAEKDLGAQIKVNGLCRVYNIGDCVEPRKIADAIYEASFFARQV